MTIFKCLRCGGNIEQSVTPPLQCANCSANYPVSNGVPLFISKHKLIDIAKAIAETCGLMDVEAVSEAIGSCSRYRLADPVLNGEFSQITDRYRSAFGPLGSPTTNAQLPFVTLIAEYFNRHLEPSECCYRSIRIRNNSDITLATEGEKPFALSYWLYDKAGCKLCEGPRSGLPVPLTPGSELSIPLLIEAPSQAGDYRIRVMLLQERVRWYEDSTLIDCNITVGHTPPTAAIRSPENVPHNGSYDFHQDIVLSGAFLEEAVKLLHSKRVTGSPIRILEVACGGNPLALNFPIQNSHVVGIDLSYFQLQIAALQLARRGAAEHNVQFQLCACDALESPFLDGSFDIVLVSAALHHFSDTVALLREMKRLVGDCGYIVVLREPCKYAPSDLTYIAELRSGFNEQQFGISEYAVMFERAGLIPVYHKVHFECSYKAILQKA